MLRAPQFSICQFTTLHASFADDLEAYAAAGASGIGVLELKLTPGDEERLRDSVLRPTVCVPSVPSILPLPLLPGPSDPAVRIESLCASIHRLARLEPVAVMFLTGPGESGRRIVVEGIKRLAEASAEAGVMLAIEPFHASQRDTFSFVNSIPDALELLAEADVDGLRLLFDTWHLGDAPQIEAEIAEHASLVACVHVSDRRRPTRAEFDRVLPGEGVLPLPQLFRALGESGYDGYYEVEIFSDDGTFGEALPDSLWALDPAVVAGRARSTFDRVWRDAWPTVPASGESDPRAE